MLKLIERPYRAQRDAQGREDNPNEGRGYIYKMKENPDEREEGVSPEDPFRRDVARFSTR
jgi:hypothetical protein